MYSEFDKIDKAKAVLEKMARGVDPLTGEVIKEDSFLNDPKIIRCFYFINEVLDNVMKGVYINRKLTEFVMTEEQKRKVVFPQNKIGVNEFSRCVNECLDLSVSKRLVGVEINRRLKKMGILSEAAGEKGKSRTVTNATSEDYGFFMEEREYQGAKYEAIVIDGKGKKYLLDNIETIMAVEV